MIDLIYKITFFVIGTLVGSFITLAIYRIPRKEDILIKRSYCPNCKHRLNFLDCFPILSYVSTVGRCKYCKKYISIRYPIIEIVNGFVFVFSLMFFGFTWKLIVFLIAYIYLFVSFGSYIMKKKMDKEEINKKEQQGKSNVDKNDKNDLDKKETKQSDVKKKNKEGLINIEIIIAFVVFVAYIITIIYASRNYNLVLQEYIKKSDALNICLNTVGKYKSYNDLELISSKEQVQVEDKIYTVDVNVYNYLKDGYIEIEDMKKIDVKVKYLLREKEEQITISFIREVDDEI